MPSAQVFVHASHEPALMADYRFYYGVRRSPLQEDTDAMGYYERWPVLRLLHKAAVIADMETVRFYNASVKVHTQYKPGDDWYLVRIFFDGWIGAGHLAAFAPVK